MLVTSLLNFYDELSSLCPSQLLSISRILCCFKCFAFTFHKNTLLFLACLCPSSKLDIMSFRILSWNISSPYIQDRICFALWPFASLSYEYLFDIYFTSVPPTSLISLWSGHISCLSWCSLTLSPIWYLGSICWIKTNDLSQLEAKGMKDWNGLCEDNCYPWVIASCQHQSHSANLGLLSNLHAWGNLAESMLFTSGKTWGIKGNLYVREIHCNITGAWLLLCASMKAILLTITCWHYLKKL